jgi:hypothetical protein
LPGFLDGLFLPCSNKILRFHSRHPISVCLSVLPFSLFKKIKKATAAVFVPVVVVLKVLKVLRVLGGKKALFFKMLLGER